LARILRAASVALGINIDKARVDYRSRGFFAIREHVSISRDDSAKVRSQSGNLPEEYVSVDISGHGEL